MKHTLLTLSLMAALAGAACAQLPGDLIISEYMANPQDVTDEQGEYIEFYNTSQQEVSMQGCVLQDASGVSVLIDQPVWVQPGEFAVVGRSAVPGASFYFPSSPPPFNLNNMGGDQISLTCNGLVIAFTQYTQTQADGVAREIGGTQLHQGGQTSEFDYLPASSQFQYIGTSTTDFGSPTFSGGTVALPVELSHFSVDLQGERAILRWTTQTELNNSHFDVEHSTDGISFTPVATITGAGTTQEPQQYSYRHWPGRPGLNYYRLAQYDYDGTLTYSDIVSVRFGNPEAGLRLYPTATAGPLHLEWDGPSSPEDVLRILDGTGRPVMTLGVPRGSTALAVDVGALVPGAYYMVLAGARQQLSAPLFRL